MAPSAVSFTAYAKPVKFSVRNARFVYEPSVYGGDRSETRVNITLLCDDSTVAELRKLEGSDDCTEGAAHRAVSLISCVKEAGVRASSVAE